jgi:hypothetical protein
MVPLEKTRSSRLTPAGSAGHELDEPADAAEHPLGDHHAADDRPGVRTRHGREDDGAAERLTPARRRGRRHGWRGGDSQGGPSGQQRPFDESLHASPLHTGIETVRAAVLADLHQRGRWLLVFDNAENPADIAGWLPGGSGHVLITSRARA